MFFRKNQRAGFTIVEVTVVLAIAGTILAIALAAVPQAQRSQRNNARKTIAQRLVTSLENYGSNNLGSYPFAGVSSTWTSCPYSNPTPPSQSCDDWMANYVNNKIDTKDPSCGSNVNVWISNVQTGSPAVTNWGCTALPNNIYPGDIYIGVGDQCSGSAFAAGQTGVGTATSKQYAVLVALEKSDNWYCVDNR